MAAELIKTLLIVGSMALYWLGSSSDATTFVNRPLKEVVQEAPIIARGRAGDHYSSWDKSGHQTLYTFTHFTVNETIKGSLHSEKILLRQPGGAKDGIEMQVPGTASFNHGEDVVLLLSKNEDDDSYEVVGMATGKYMVRNEGGQSYLVNAIHGESLYDPAHDPKAGHSESVLSRISYEEFKKIVRGEQSAAGQQKQFQNAKQSEPARTLTKGVTPAIEKKSAVPATLDAASANAGTEKNSFLILGTMVLLLFGAGVLLWLFLK